MHISFTCNNIGTGGAERVICNLANRMVQDGHTVNIVCYQKLPNFYYDLKEGVSIVEIDPHKNLRKYKVLRKVAGIVDLRRLFKAIKGSDRVVSFYTRQNCYSIIMSRIQRIPVICSERDHFFMNDGKVNHYLRKAIYPHASGFIHQTHMARHYLRENEGVKCKDVVIPNPLWITDFPNRNPVKDRVVAVGRLAEQKNYEGLLKAFSIVYGQRPSATLCIYGEGPLRAQLECLAKALELDKAVYFMGNEKNILNAYANADVFVLYSHGEGYPNALMEALAVGVPCIASDCPVGGPDDMIIDGKNGFLVQCGADDILAQRILTLLENEDLKQQFSNNAIEIRSTNLFESIYQKYMDFILSC